MTTSNEAPFSPVLRIFPGGNPADASTWGAGYDISSKVRYPGSEGGQPITYSAGRPDEATQVDPGQMALTLDNTSGDFSTANPNGPYYGLLRRGTPIQLSMISGEDSFTRTVSGGLGTSSGGNVWTSTAIWSTDGSSGQAAIAVDNFASAPLLTGADAADFDGRLTVWTEVVATGAALIYGMAARATDAQNLLMFTCEFNLAGQVDAKIRSIVDNVYTELGAATLADTYAANDKFRMRIQGDGPSLRLKVWMPADPADPDADEPDDWSVTATDTAVTDVQCGLFMWRLDGNTNAGTVNFLFDDYRFEAVEFTGSVIKWPVRWDKSGNTCWAPITAAGPLRRLRQGSGTLRSPLARQLPFYEPIGYWPLEDGADAHTFASAVEGVPPAAKSGSTVTPAADTTLAGATQSPTLGNATASIRGITPNRQTGTGFSAMFFCKLASLPAAKTKVATFGGSGRIITWNIYIDSVPNLTIEGIESDGTVTVNTSNAFPADVDPLEWTAYQLETDYAGGTLEWANIMVQVGGTTFYAQSGSFATSVPARVWAWQLGGGSSDLDGAAFAHVWIGENTLPFVDETFALVSDGYRGELASDRITRLCAEEGVPVAVEAGTSAALGPQRTGNFLDAIQSAADADYGVLYEAGNGLGYRPLAARYNRAVTFALAVADGEIDEPPEPVDDDQRVRNDWTVSRDSGSFARALDQVHIDAEGRYEDSATINVETDDVLPDNAGWRLYLGTRNELRWPGLTLNFARATSLIPTWRARPFASRMTVDTGLDQVAGADPDVIVEGYECTLWPHGWTASLNCSGAAPWDQIVLDDGLRLDAKTDDDGTATCTLAEDLTTTETLVNVVTDTGLPVWAGTTEINGTVIVVGGEEMTVTATSGTGASQTLTMTRSTNGIVKTHASGAAVYLAQPTFLSL